MLPDSCQSPEPETNVAPVTPEVNETKDTTEADTASSTIPTIPAPVATGEDSVPESTSPAADLLSLIENRDSITPAASDKGQTSIAVILPFMLASEMSTNSHNSTLNFIVECYLPPTRCAIATAT